MPTVPKLKTERLVLRSFQMSDARDVQRYAGEEEVARIALDIPYPFEDGVAEHWISMNRQGFEDGRIANFAITVKGQRGLVGAIGLAIDRRHKRAELGYWVGRPFWGKGYCTEAAREVLRFAFEDLGLNRVYAEHFTRNAASAKVAGKLGMRREGTLRQHVEHWGEFEDVEHCGILREEYESAREKK